ncbi:nucleotidyltransferase [Peribacillus asahii]|uniref:nucleotidyltransferase n=1 Tax=Peribacillus asahii TaxID=228899 RepID=UPI0037F17B9C
MKAVGVVVEYNPFHNGHALHIQESKKQTEADVVIAVMSGSFLQRGEPALVNKWARTDMALRGGVDLVIELPYRFATANAELFARGSISLLEAMQCDAFCFGSEDGKIAPFLDTYHLLQEKETEYKSALKTFLKEGKSYPAAASLAFRSLSSNERGLDLSQPNNILGKEYVHAALSNNYKIEPFTIKRVAAGYHETTLHDKAIASATGIRKAIIEQKQSMQTISSYVPHSTLAILETYITYYRNFHHWELYWPLLKYRILTSSAAELADIYEVEEGIEHRLLDIAKHSSTFQQFVTQVKTKRYTWTRIQRICTHILTHSLQAEMEDLSFPSYLRLLGMTEKGQQYLQLVKKELPLPLISKISAYNNSDITPDLRATNVFAQSLPEPYQTELIQREFAAPIRLKV